MNRIASLVLITIAMCVMVSFTARAQRPGAGGGAQGNITGTVIDAATKEPLRGASVVLRNAADTTLVTGAIAERDGSFAINGIRPGRYHARISFIGYVTYRTDVGVKPGAADVAMGDIGLRIDSSLSNGVSVTARREFMTQAIDRTIFRTEDLAVATGGTATDILRNIPSIEVDVDGNVSLRGNQNVVVQINGRPSMLSGDALASFLRSLPANAIERVEVIPNPSAKDDPDGMSGIINIVLKQDSNRGLSGGVNGSLGTHNNYNAGGNISYGAGPWNISASYGFNYADRSNDGSYLRQDLLPTAAPYLDQISTEKSTSPSHTFNGSVDYALDKSNTLSLTAILSQRNSDETGVNAYYERDSAQTLLQRYDRLRDQASDGSAMDYRLAYKTVFEPVKHELSAEVRYSTNTDNDDARYVDQTLALDGTTTSATPNRQNTTDGTRSHDISFQTDYVRTFDAGTRLEAGYKGELERFNSDFNSSTFDYAASAFIVDTALDNSFVYDRQIHAVYANLGQDFGQFSAQAGVRAEQALSTFNLTTTGEHYRNDYFSLFPSAFISYKPTDGIQLKLSYSKRINRPRIHSLNPFRNYEDPLVIRTGNPYLKPEYTHAFEFSASYFTEKASFTVTPYFRRTNDVMRRLATIDTSGVTTVTFQNLATNDSYGAEFIGTLKVSDWLNGFLSGGAYRWVTDASNVDASYSNNSLGWNMRANATFTILTGLDLQATYFYRAPMVIEKGKMGSFSSADLALQQKLFGDRGRVGIRVSDIFNTMGYSVSHTDGNFYTSLHHKWDSRNLFLTFSYAFGAQDRSKRRSTGERQQANPDVMDME